MVIGGKLARRSMALSARACRIQGLFNMHGLWTDERFGATGFRIVDTRRQ
jgi:hypothetical protein